MPVEEKKPRGRPPKITPRDRSTIGQLVARNEVPTSKQITTELSTTIGTSVTPRTVRRHLVDMDYKNSVPRKVPLLTAKQKTTRVQWCKQHQRFDWKKVWFSDETYIEVSQTTTPIWHKKGKRPTVAKPKFSAKIMCWGTVSTRFKSKLVVVEEIMTAPRYKAILLRYLLHENGDFNVKTAVFQQETHRLTLRRS